MKHKPIPASVSTSQETSLLSVKERDVFVVRDQLTLRQYQVGQRKKLGQKRSEQNLGQKHTEPVYESDTGEERGMMGKYRTPSEPVIDPEEEFNSWVDRRKEFGETWVMVEEKDFVFAKLKEVHQPELSEGAEIINWSNVWEDIDKTPYARCVSSKCIQANWLGARYTIESILRGVVTIAVPTVTIPVGIGLAVYFADE